MDVHVRRAVTLALRLRSIDVLTAQEDGAAELDDDQLLHRATELGRVLVSEDEDLLREGASRLREISAYQTTPRRSRLVSTYATVPAAPSTAATPKFTSGPRFQQTAPMNDPAVTTVSRTR